MLRSWLCVCALLCPCRTSDLEQQLELALDGGERLDSIVQALTLNPDAFSDADLNLLQPWGRTEQPQPQPLSPNVGLADCPALPPRPPPATAWELSPADFRVVLSVGDSASMGWAVQDKSQAFRGSSPFVGIDTSAITLPNMLKQYTTNISGGVTTNNLDTAKTVSQAILYGQRGGYKPIKHEAAATAASVAAVPPMAGCDASLLGARISDCPAQIDSLVGCFNKTHSQDWKLLTLFMGLPDILNDCCNNATTDDPHYQQWLSNFLAGYQTCLEAIETRIPNVFVSMMSLPDVSNLASLHASDTGCQKARKNFFRMYDVLHKVLKNWGRNMRCVLGPDSQNDASSNDISQVAYAISQANQHFHALAKQYSAKRLDGMAVAVQPVMQNVQFSVANLSRFDCIHPNTQTNSRFSVATWNAMVTADAEKLSGCQGDTCDKASCLTQQSRMQVPQVGAAAGL